jgi:hypothetical protein
MSLLGTFLAQEVLDVAIQSFARSSTRTQSCGDGTFSVVQVPSMLVVMTLSKRLPVAGS